MHTVRLSSIAVLLAVWSSACGSLIDETERIRMLYAQKNPVTVITTDPADNSFAPYNQTYIDVVFSTGIDIGTVTAQANFGACTGSLQVSYDGFTNCLGGAIDASGNPRIRFTPAIFPKGLGLQIMVTSAVQSDIGVAATPYVSGVGFKLGAPCGKYNCFFSYSTPLVASAGTLSGVFLIRSGAHIGKYLVYTTGSTNTTMIDPLTATSVVGPTFCAIPTGGTTNYYVSTGPDAGRQVIFIGGSGNRCLYDPTTHTFVNGAAGPTIGAGTNAFAALSGTESGHGFIVDGGNTPGVSRYDANTGVVSSPLTLGINAGGGSHNVRLTNGANAGNTLIIAGNNATNVRMFVESSATIATAQATSVAVGAGGASFEVFTGPNANRLITIHGAGATSTTSFDLSTNLLVGATGSVGPTITAVNTGGLLLRQNGTASLDNPLMLLGGGVTTNRYNSTTGLFESGPLTTGNILSGSSAIYIPNAQGTGVFFIVNGGGTSTSLYVPSTNTFHGSRVPATIPNQGASAFVVNGGANNGRTMIVGGNGLNTTAVFDPLRFEMSLGPLLTANPTLTSFNVPIRQGVHAGKTIVFFGGSNAYNLYDPTTNTFSATGLPAINTLGAGAVAFPVANSTNLVLVRGGGTFADIYDQQTNGALTNITIPCSVGSAAFTLRYTKPSNGEVRQLVFCSGTSMAVFNHTTQTFPAFLSLTSGAGTGIQGFVIPSGAHANEVLIIHGGGATGTTLINPETDAVIGAGPATTPGCSVAPNAGSQILQLTTGFNSGKVVLLSGGGSETSCIYDPATHAFSAGPKVGNNGSPGFQITAGSLAFRTNGGLYPTSFIVLSGATKNVWNAYVP